MPRYVLRLIRFECGSWLAKAYKNQILDLKAHLLRQEDMIKNQAASLAVRDEVIQEMRKRDAERDESLRKQMEELAALKDEVRVSPR